MADEPGDLLSGGSDRAPWRPGRGLVLVAATAVVAAALGVAGVEYAQRQRAMDRESVSQVVVYVAEVSAWAEEDDGIRLVLTNGGPDEVQLESIRLVREGDRTVAVDKPLRPEQLVEVLLPWSHRCDVATLSAAPTAVEVRLRTHRGSAVARVEPVPEPGASHVLDAQRQRCGFLLPPEALTSRLVSARRVGDRIDARLELWNLSSHPYDLTELRAFTGIEASVKLPVALPAQRRSPTVLPLSLRVLDCAYLKASWRFPEEIGIDGLYVSLSNDVYSGVATLTMTSVDGDESGPPDPTVIPLLQELCPFGR